MANSNIMKEAFANLKFDKKIKEGAVTGKDYKDAKSFQQFYAETRKRCDRKKEIYQKVLDNYKPDRKLIRRLDATQLSESIRDPLDLSPSDQFIMLRVADLATMDQLYKDFHNAVMAREGLKRMELLPGLIKEMVDFEDNEATKNGVEEVNQVIQGSEPLMALVLSSTKDDGLDDKDGLLP